MKILFVCLGNICRSPTAEAVFRKHFADRKIDAEFDSAGTANYHVGEGSDRRSIKHAEARCYVMDHITRQVTSDDFKKFDLIFAMDKSNFENLKKICPDGDLLKKLHLVLSDQQVPDPYYEGPKVFEHIIDLLEAAVEPVIKKFFKESIAKRT